MGGRRKLPESESNSGAQLIGGCEGETVKVGLVVVGMVVICRLGR